MPNPIRMRKLPDDVRRRLELAAATSWESLVETHASHALRFIALLADRLAFDEAVDRYVREMDLEDALASAVRMRVLVALEDAQRNEPDRPSVTLESDDDAGDDGVGGWRRFRPDQLVRDVKRRQKAHEETSQWIRLAIARAEEAAIMTHVDNALSFAALLDSHLPLSAAVEEYIDALRLTGARAQAVHQRAMARLADEHLTPADGDAVGG